MTIEELKPYQDMTVLISMNDGELLTARVAFVDAEYEDIVVDIVHTNRLETYRVPISSAAFTIPATNITSIQVVPN